MHLLQMAKIDELHSGPAIYRMYCSCGGWFTLAVRQGTPEWVQAQEDFFEHLAELEEDDPA